MKIIRIIHTSYQSFMKGENYYLDNPNTEIIESFIANWKYKYEPQLAIMDAYSWNVEVYYDDGTVNKYQGYGGRPNNYDDFLNYMKENGKAFKRTVNFKGHEIELP